MQKLFSMLILSMAILLPGCSESSGFGNPGELNSGKKPVPFKHHTNASVLSWNSFAQSTMAGPDYNPLLATRIMTMMHIAMHDALNNIAPVYETYAHNQPDKKADPIAALSSAAHAVLLSSFPDKKDHLDSALHAAIANVKPGLARERGVQLGKAAAETIISLRSNDDAFRNPIAEISNPVLPGLYQPVPPTPIVYAPFWKDLTPFSLNNPAHFRISPFPALNSEEYARDLNEVKSKGSLNSTSRTTDETYVAKFWYELSEIGWNRIAHIVAAQQNLDLLTTTRLFALVNIALADSYIAGWDSKFHYDFWRPYTAIRAAETDGNNLTTPDESWEPLMATPPVQDYPSTHSTLGNASAVVLSEVVGENVAFSMVSTSADPANNSRSFQNFYEAARENSESRILAGIHFRFSCQKGLELGEKIGFQIMKTRLRPIQEKSKNL